MKIYNMESTGPPRVNIHSKFMRINGVWNGEERQLLLTGSQNFTANSLENNNEASLLFRDHEFYSEYEEYFSKLKTLSVVCCSAKPKTKY